jgi:hypothetical protein
MAAADGKQRPTDAATAETLLRRARTQQTTAWMQKVEQCMEQLPKEISCENGGEFATIKTGSF